MFKFVKIRGPQNAPPSIFQSSGHYVSFFIFFCPTEGGLRLWLYIIIYYLVAPKRNGSIDLNNHYENKSPTPSWGLLSTNSQKKSFKRSFLTCSTSNANSSMVSTKVDSQFAIFERDELRCLETIK